MITNALVIKKYKKSLLQQIVKVSKFNIENKTYVKSKAIVYNYLFK
jgi:hypothetical protein